MNDSKPIPNIIVEKNDDDDNPTHDNDMPNGHSRVDMRRRASELFVELMPVEQMRKIAHHTTGWWSECQFFVGKYGLILFKQMLN
jgi:hypothetical protein